MNRGADKRPRYHKDAWRAVFILIGMGVMHWLWLPIIFYAPDAWKTPLAYAALAWFGLIVVFNVYHLHKGTLSKRAEG